MMAATLDQQELGFQSDELSDNSAITIMYNSTTKGGNWHTEFFVPGALMSDTWNANHVARGSKIQT